MELIELDKTFWIVIIILGLWELVWKGIALWKAGRNNHLVWFILILILNTVAILPIIYLVLLKTKRLSSYDK